MIEKLIKELNHFFNLHIQINITTKNAIFFSKLSMKKILYSYSKKFPFLKT